MSAYQAILDEIATLQAKADALRESEKSEAIKTVNGLIERFGIRASELRFRSAKSAAKVVVKDGRSVVLPRYSDGAGNAWSGRGRQPAWLRAGIASGRTLESFALRAGD